MRFPPSSSGKHAMKVVIIDNSLRNKVGHQYEYDSALAAVLRGRGCTVQVYAHRDLDQYSREELIAVPIFPMSELEEYRPLPFYVPFSDFLFGNPSFFLALARAKIHLEDPDLVLDHTITPKHLVGLFAWRSLLLRKKRTTLVVLLRFDIRSQHDELAYRIAFLAKKIMPGRVIFATDSDELAARYSPMVGETIHVLPIPHVPAISAPGGSLPKHSRKVVVAFPGIAGENKGFHFLPEVVDRIAAAGIDMRFIVQTVMPMPTQILLEALRRLKSFEREVHIIDRPLSTSEYHAMLQGADCVLLPYDPVRYGGQTSGVFTEALAAGKVVLATRTRWMERNMEQYDSGVFIEEFSSTGILEAIKSYLGNREREEERAAHAAERWRAYHNPDSYVEHLFRACGLG